MKRRLVYGMFKVKSMGHTRHRTSWGEIEPGSGQEGESSTLRRTTIECVSVSQESANLRDLSVSCQMGFDWVGAQKE